MDKLTEFKLRYPKLFVRKETRFDKTKSLEDGYMEIYANKMFTKVNIKTTVNNMRNFQGFCACNELPSGRFAKLQGGYYILTEDSKWEYVGDSLDSITFEEVFKKLSGLTNPNKYERIREIENSVSN